MQILPLIKKFAPTVKAEPFAGELIAKIDVNSVRGKSREGSNLVLVTAMTPTKFGEGKTCTSVGLNDSLNRLKKNSSIVCLREPSLGPVFGMKGGAAGGGKSQLIPLVDINLHFTGDIHAVGSAHNLLSAFLDNQLHWGGSNLDARRITWRRVMDMQDRALRNIVVGLGGPTEGVPREDGFDITVASEVMATLCLSRDFKHLKENLSKMIVGESTASGFVTVADMKLQGSMAALLVNAMKPNAVQSLEGNLALIHGGPFANIAHGCSSLIATETAMRMGSEFVVTEAGFGADLGAEKFLHIKCRQNDLSPSAAVVVATVRALKMHGNGEMKAGLPNLLRHVENLRKFNLPYVVVSINVFPDDTDAELNTLVAELNKRGVDAVISRNFALGSEGGMELAEKISQAVKDNKTKKRSAPPRYLYELDAPYEEKVKRVASEIYRATNVEFSSASKTKLKRFQDRGFGNLPICVAKTQYSFSDDATKLNAPENHTLHVQDVRLSAGAGFVVVLTGSVMTMPGLPRAPNALKIDVDDDGNVTGLI